MKTTFVILLALLLSLTCKVNVYAQVYTVSTTYSYTYSQVVPVYQDVAVYQNTYYGWQFVGYRRQFVGWQQVDCSCPAPDTRQNENYPDTNDENDRTRITHTPTKPGFDENGDPTPGQWAAVQRSYK